MVYRRRFKKTFRVTKPFRYKVNKVLKEKLEVKQNVLQYVGTQFTNITTAELGILIPQPITLGIAQGTDAYSARAANAGTTGDMRLGNKITGKWKKWDFMFRIVNLDGFTMGTNAITNVAGVGTQPASSFQLYGHWPMRIVHVGVLPGQTLAESEAAFAAAFPTTGALTAPIDPRSLRIYSDEYRFFRPNTCNIRFKKFTHTSKRYSYETQGSGTEYAGEELDYWAFVFRNDSIAVTSGGVNSTVGIFPQLYGYTSLAFTDD